MQQQVAVLEGPGEVAVPGAFVPSQEQHRQAACSSRWQCWWAQGSEQCLAPLCQVRSSIGRQHAAAGGSVGGHRGGGGPA